MRANEHKLILDYQNRRVRAQCSCGTWARPPVATRLQSWQEVYHLLETEHWQHAEGVNSQKPGFPR